MLQPSRSFSGVSRTTGTDWNAKRAMASRGTKK